MVYDIIGAVSYQKKLSLLLAIVGLWTQTLHAAENRAKSGDEIDDTIARPSSTDQNDVLRVDRFVIFNEKLKSAVCDETAASKPPSLDSIAAPEEHPTSEFLVPLPKKLPEHELISFILGDSLAGVYSDFVRAQVESSFQTRGLAKAIAAGSISSEQFLDAQSMVMGVKRRTSLEVCEALVRFERLRALLNARPSRFIEAIPLGAPVSNTKGLGFLAEVLDTGGRFGRVGDRLAASKPGAKQSSKYLIPGWLESYEVDRVKVLNGKGTTLRTYRRLSNPLTNNTQSVEIINSEGVPLGVLFLSRDPTARDWSSYRNWAELPEARVRQIETYRSRIEFDAVKRLQSGANVREQIRNLQEFYKNLLQAYQLFPNEKQFDTYNKTTAKKQSLDEITKNILGTEFLDSLRQARVNGSFVHVGLFRPDPKLHAIYSEYEQRLAKLAH